MTEKDGRTIWVITPKADISCTHAGGREIHIIPYYQRPLQTQMYAVGRTDPVSGVINTRRFLSEEDLNIARQAFPSAVGMRVYFSSFAIVLFRSQNDLDKSWRNDQLVTEFGGLRLGYDVIDTHTMTVESKDVKHEISVGKPVARLPDWLGSSASLGLKLRLSSGICCITVPTHAFVKLPKQIKSQAMLRLVNQLARVKLAMRRFSPGRSEPTPAIGTSRKHLTNSPLGRVVWIAGESIKVCVFYKALLAWRFYTSLILYCNRSGQSQPRTTRPSQGLFPSPLDYVMTCP